MSTRSFIAIKRDDGSFEGIYCHSDGYIEQPGVGWTLQNHYTDPAKVRELIDLGDLSGLAARVKPEEGEAHSYSQRARENGGVTTAYHRDRGEPREDTEAAKVDSFIELRKTAKDCGADFAYLFMDGKWFVWQPYRGGAPKTEEELILNHALTDYLKADATAS